MGRPEWILFAVILSLGLLGFAVAGVGAGPASTGAPAELATAGSATADPATGGPGDGEPTQLRASIAAPDAIDRHHSIDARDANVVVAPNSNAVTDPDSTTLDATDRFLAPPQQEFERSTFRVRVDADADVRWTFRYERPIESDDERSAFETYAERVRTEATDLFRDFRNRSTELTAAASAVTGRSMSARNVTRDAGIEQTPTQEVGYVELSFEWTNFGRVDGGSIVVGDVFEGGLYLGETQSLIFVAGEGVQFESVDPQASPSGEQLSDSHSVTWTGERSFADRHPRVVYRVPGSGGGGDAGVSMLWLAAGGVIGLLLVTVLVTARYGGIPSTESRDDGTAAAAATVSTESTTGGIEEPTDPEPTPPEEPITDDRRVTRLLEDGGGRMKQTAIVEETGWSKSKVSMLLSEMEADGEIRKIQIGRENIIALEGHEPEAATSPFDDAE
ncbi:hypothetical protein GCM10028857_03010 [Salinarchaeum chitinilyticum]